MDWIFIGLDLYAKKVLKQEQEREPSGSAENPFGERYESEQQL
jgi:hypothetical protein